jgi:hypothetical protein
MNVELWVQIQLALKGIEKALKGLFNRWQSPKVELNG